MFEVSSSSIAFAAAILGSALAGNATTLIVFAAGWVGDEFISEKWTSKKTRYFRRGAA